MPRRVSVDRSRADGINWLVLASHPLDEVTADTREAFEALARKGHGEYDGWEIDEP